MKITVSIPTFNRAHLIGHAIDSVLAQTYKNVEVVVVDDGSTDNTAAVVAGYGDRVRYHWQKNGGLGVARNTGLDLATGDCIAFLDSDDYWYPFKLELQVALLTRLEDVSFTFSEFTILKDDGSTTPQGSRTWLADNVRWDDIYPLRLSARDAGVQAADVAGDFPIYTGRMYRRFLDEAFVLPTTAMVRRDALRGLRFTEGMTIFEDWEFFARLARDNDGAFTDIETAVNRGHNEPGRLTRCSSLAKAECYLDMLERVWKADPVFRAEYGDVLRQAESAAALAVAERALLAARPDVVRRALARWRGIEGRDNFSKAAACAVLSQLPGGRGMFRAGRLAQKLVKRIVTGSSHGSTAVNPAA
jgi:glycosyltransferase involved in cell wall biosynthesis